MTSIGDYCFSYNESLTSIQLPSSLISIGYFAFRYTNISTITIPDGVTSIGNYCFYKCTSLTNIELPSTLINIGDRSFSHTGLKQIEVTKNFHIGQNAFDSNCKVIRK